MWNKVMRGWEQGEGRRECRMKIGKIRGNVCVYYKYIERKIAREWKPVLLLLACYPFVLV
jgi:hypothetical protein